MADNMGIFAPRQAGTRAATCEVTNATVILSQMALLGKTNAKEYPAMAAIEDNRILVRSSPKARPKRPPISPNKPASANIIFTI